MSFCKLNNFMRIASVVNPVVKFCQTFDGLRSVGRGEMAVAFNH